MTEAETTFVHDCLRAAGLVAEGDEVAVEPLGGGVSNDVYAARVGERWFVLKRALAKLRVKEDWRSDVDRVHREAACQRWLAGVLAPGEVPAVRWECFERHAYVMDRAPLDCVNWRDEMLAGRVDPDAAARAGIMLGAIHAAGRVDVSMKECFGSKHVFDQLRLDPYLRTIAARHPALAEPVNHCLAQCLASTETLVHGDYSPKNILLQPGRNVLLDHEVAHCGEPCFDLGFFFTHLCLKALHVAAQRSALMVQVPAAWAGYRHVYPHVSEARWLPYLGCMMLARVDGKSPAGYLTADEEERVRKLAPRLLRGELTTLEEALAALARVAETGDVA
ncbi:MAG: phosphotransferase [Armatimonadetes bacterium]|nr:phosphotransferase [Armatimonadota bacterium]